MEYLYKFQQFLQLGQCNNSLMKGIVDPKKSSYADKKLEFSQNELRKIITIIVGKFCLL